MTPEQESVRREKQRAYYAARRPLKNDRQRAAYASDPQYRASKRAQSLDQKANHEVKERNRQSARDYYANNREKVLAREKAKQRARSLMKQFDRFMARLLTGEDVYGFGE